MYRAVVKIALNMYSTVVKIALNMYLYRTVVKIALNMYSAVGKIALNMYSAVVKTQIDKQILYIVIIFKTRCIFQMLMAYLLLLFWGYSHFHT